MTDAGGTRDRILDAALELMYERGYEGTTTRAIAEAAGVNEVTLFRQFGTKRNVFIAVIDRETDIAEELTDTQIAFVGDLRADLRMAGERMAHEMAAKGKLVKLIMMEAHKDPGIWAHVSHTPFSILGHITKYFEGAMAEGRVRDADPYLMAIAFFSFFFRSMIANAFLGSDVFIDMGPDTIGAFVDMFITGVRAEV